MRYIINEKENRLSVLLVRPFQKTNELQPPLGLGYLASTIKSMHKVRILDCIRNKITEKEFKAFLERNRFDVIGFQCYTLDINIVKKLSKIAHSIYPEATLIVGGPQPTMDPINTLKYMRDVDYVFIGEAEISFPLFIKYLSDGSLKNRLKRVPGIAFIKDGEYQKNERVFPEELDMYNPSWELFDLKSYPDAPHGGFCKQKPTAPLIITRGCPFQCNYCGGPLISGRKVRSHSVDYIISQIEILNKKYGIKEIHIEDDNFTIKREFVEDFCKQLIEKNLGVTWTCPNGIRVDTLDGKLISLMKKSGLYSISVGIESGSDRIRKLMKKNLDTKTIIEKVNLIHRCGIGLIGFFIVGYPGETKSDIKKTVRLACSLPLKRATFSAFKPFPGTEIYDELVRDNKINKMNWNNFSLDKVVWSPDGISKRELKNLRRYAFLRFYLRPKILFKMLSEVKSLENFKFIVKRIYRWMV